MGELDRTWTDEGEEKYVIGRPNSGKPFYITQKSVGELQTSIKKVARTHAVESAALNALLP